MIAKNQQLIKLFIVLFVSTFLIFSASFFGAQLMDRNQTAVNTAADKPQKTAENAKTAAAVARPAQEIVIMKAVVKMDSVPDDLQTFLAGNGKIELPAQASFSLLQLAKKQKLETINPETLSIIATGIYQAILPTNFTIEERNIGKELPAYARLGFEAKVNPGENEDLIFFNPNKTNYLLELKQIGSSLNVDLKGVKLSYYYTITTKNEQQLIPKTISQYSPVLAQGQTMVTASGRNGQTVTVFRNTYRGKMLVNSEFIANDYYPPDDRVVVQSLAVPDTQQTAGTGTVTSQPDGLSTNTIQTNQNTQASSGSQTAASTDNSSK